jgi:hypothetical protein
MRENRPQLRVKENRILSICRDIYKRIAEEKPTPKTFVNNNRNNFLFSRLMFLFFFYFSSLWMSSKWKQKSFRKRKAFSPILSVYVHKNEAQLNYGLKPKRMKSEAEKPSNRLYAGEVFKKEREKLLRNFSYIRIKLRMSFLISLFWVSRGNWNLVNHVLEINLFDFKMVNSRELLWNSHALQNSC